MSLSTQPYKGTRDFYPQDKRVQKYMFAKLNQVVESFGYQQYDAPILEPIEIYLAKTGEEIINEQLYSFTDKGDRKLAIRPEMTPSVSRMVAAKRQELAYPLRLYSIPNLWRYERPQKGRLREHWQLNVDLFGEEGLAADHEIILIADLILKAFDAPKGSYVIRISSRKLVDYFFKEVLKLDEHQFHQAIKLIDNARKIDSTEFASKAASAIADESHREQLAQLLKVNDVDDLPDSLKPHQSIEQIRKLLEMLKTSGVEAATFDFSIIRGMDYYDDIIFEVFDTSPDNNRSMFGGGRYDGLIGEFGVEPLPTVGFGMGDVTLRNFLDLHDLLPELNSEVDAIAIIVGDIYDQAQPVLTQLRKEGVMVAVDSTQRKMDVQIKNAVKSGVRHVIFIGEKEIINNKFGLRDLQKGDQKELTIDQIASSLSIRR